MSSFEPLGLSADLIDALAAEGVESPTPIQTAALPVVRRGGNVLIEAGPGAGTLLTYGAALLDRIGEPSRQCVLVVAPGDEEANALAIALARFAETRGFSVAALGGVWSTPTDASIVFGSALRMSDLLKRSALDLEAVQTLVIDRVEAIEARDGLDGVTLLAEALPGVQKVFLGLPISEDVEALARRTCDKPVHLPPRSATKATARPAGAASGSLQYRLVAGQRTRHLLEIVHERLVRANRDHVTVHFRGDDLAADVGDILALHGFSVGSFGDSDSQVWLCTPTWEQQDPPEAMVTVISYEPPVSAERARLEHLGYSDSIVLVEARELGHLEQVAAGARLELRPLPVRGGAKAEDALRRLKKRLRAQLDGEDLIPFLLLAERLGEEFDPMQVAAAALAIAYEPASATPTPSGATTTLPEKAASWVKLFFSIGSRDEVGPGDLLGAITGETGVSGSQVGRIDIHDSYTVVDVDSTQAERVMRSVNGTTIRGRSVRVDFDRGGAKKARVGRADGLGRTPSGARRPR